MLKILRHIRIKPSQAILFSPALLLALTIALVLRNQCSRPIIRVWDSPDRTYEAVVYLEYPPMYPFRGEVQAFIEILQRPGRASVLKRELGVHRWASQVKEEYGRIDWEGGDRVILWSEDGQRQWAVPWELSWRSGGR